MKNDAMWHAENPRREDLPFAVVLIGAIVMGMAIFAAGILFLGS